MQVLDAAVLVISGTDGVQSHTETLWKLLEHYEVPVFLFVNKMDLNGAEREQVLAELQSRLGEGCLDFSDVTDPAFLEAAAMCEEPLMEEFLENGEISTDALRRSIARRKLFPCYFGSALKLEGVTEFLQGLECYTTPPSYGDAFAAQVFKISSDEKGSRLTHLKITGGALHVRDAISYTTESGTVCTEKVSQIRCYSGTKFQTVETIPAGAVCTVTGLSRTFCGQGLGASENSTHPVLEPVMSYALQFPAGTNLHAALQKLLPLEEEEPSLHLVWNESLQEVQVQLMGAVQKEILEQRIAQRFDLSVTFGSGRIGRPFAARWRAWGITSRCATMPRCICFWNRFPKAAGCSLPPTVGRTRWIRTGRIWCSLIWRRRFMWVCSPVRPLQICGSPSVPEKPT